MTAAVHGATTLAKVLVVLAFAILFTVGLGLAALLAVTGYIAFCVGSTNAALLFWTAATAILAGVAILGVSLPDWMKP